MCTPPLISQDIHRFCLVYTTTCTFSTYYMNAVSIIAVHLPLSFVCVLYVGSYLLI